MKLIQQIEGEISRFYTGTTEISEGVRINTYKIIKRIYLFKNRTYPLGQIDKQGKYKQWIDVIMSRVNAEVKNLKMDSKDFLWFSESPIRDFPLVYFANIRTKEFMRDTGRGEEINESAEDFSADGNLIFARVKGGYEVLDPLNFIITNETARTIDDTDIIIRKELTQSQLKEKSKVWNHIDEVIENCRERSFRKNRRTASKEAEKPYYEVFQRDGEVSEQDLFEAQGKKGGDKNKYVMARIVSAGLKKGAEDHKYVLFAEPLDKKLSDLYITAHRGPYKGKFWREGLYELLFDIQVRANEISNQLSRGLEWASRVIFRYSDNELVQNILTDLQNGDAIKSTDLSQVNVRMIGLDQLIADWNRLMEEADKIANSFEVVQGDSMPSGTPFRLGLLMDSNANKLFVFLRQKLDLAYSKVYNQWTKKDLLAQVNGKDIVRVTGDPDFLERFRELIVNQWYINNLINIGPHSPEMKQMILEAKMVELQDKDMMMKNVDKKKWKDALSRLHITITGENSTTDEKMETIANLLQFEVDPVRRAYLMDQVYAVKGIKVPPPMPPQEQQQPQPQQQQPESEIGQMEREAVTT